MLRGHWLVWFACVVLLVGCQRKVTFASGEAGQDAKGPTSDSHKSSREGDKRYENMIAGKPNKNEAGEVDHERAAEARGWLNDKQAPNAMWKTSKSQTLDMVDQLYKSGAHKVYCIYAPADDTIKINMCASLLVELPREANRRQEVLAKYNQLSRQFWGEDHENVKDLGQRFVELDLDP